MNNKWVIDNIGTAGRADITQLLDTYSEEDRLYAGEKARQITRDHFGNKIYIRGIIEFTNHCRNNCLYCGIRCGNRNVSRYRMSDESILKCCENGYRTGIRTFVLQGGEDAYYSDDRLCGLVSSIRRQYPDCAITLSVGERSFDSYRKLREAGADRYLLRHETADKEHYSKLHPEGMSFDNRMSCLHDLKKLGYQTGCGMMVGSPYQTPETLAEDLIFMRGFRPQMVGIGPFLPQKDTPFAQEKPGSVDMTLFLISLIRIMLPDVLLPSTTALGTAENDGRIKGILAGANVYMPNLSPEENREKYLLYDNKDGLMDDAAYVIQSLKTKLGKYGYQIVTDRGDYEEISDIR
ncbi:MAG: [FeFe] hydrogenase H-cluster radical SAM maturase HydE [Lachnospiraceae bacterium]|nr:[FeFe] hydrogenase H-cluster radical SAM maturase HydE [Lachnospiraceae bacterium]